MAVYTGFLKPSMSQSLLRLIDISSLFPQTKFSSLLARPLPILPLRNRITKTNFHKKEESRL